MPDSIDQRIEDRERAEQMASHDLQVNTFVELCALSRKVGEQNGRVHKIEKWMNARTTIERFLIGGLFLAGAVFGIVKVFL